MEQSAAAINLSAAASLAARPQARCQAREIEQVLAARSQVLAARPQALAARPQGRSKLS